MNFEAKYTLVIAAAYLWIGFVCAISFMEAWLKFRAPGVDLRIGLGIGRLVFNALNKVEWTLAIIIVLIFLLGGENVFNFSTVYFFISVILLLLQTLWLLPALDARAERRIQEQFVPRSNLHVYFVGAEVLKVSSLVIFTFKLFN
jgi:hypothetical protein